MYNPDRHYCTLFDQNYLAKGLAMYRSLKRQSSESFVLHIIAMDDVARAVLEELQLPYVAVYPIAAFESEMRLASVRSGRSWQEYCWTCASIAVDYLLSWHKPEMLTYIDADLMFFSDPKAVFDEIGDRSIAITPHRFPARKQYMERNGKFNVGWVSFRSDEAGIMCSKRWAEQCREWCFYRNESGKFADQGYLDAWPQLYASRLCEIQNIGVNAAPWNIGQYDVNAGVRVGDAPILTFKDQALHGLGRTPLVCYHLHEYEHGVRTTAYNLSEAVHELIYRPYIREYNEAESSITGSRERLRESQQALAARGEWQSA